MSTLKRIAPTDSRTPEQREADDAVARAAESGCWDGWEVLLTEEGAEQISQRRQELARHPGASSASLNGQLFRWKQRVFQIVHCEYVDGKALVEITPQDDEFVLELRKRMEADPFHHLNYCQRFGFVCFPEDYAKYEH